MTPTQTINNNGNMQSTITFPDKTNIVKCKCPHCGLECGHASIEYHRSYNSNMALAIILLMKENTFDYVHLENLILSKGHKRCGDFSYLVHYGQIQKKEGKREDGSNKNGMYRITSAGIMFAEGKTYVHKKFIMRDGIFYGFTGGMINIQDALKTKFNYSELIS